VLDISEAVNFLAIVSVAQPDYSRGEYA